MKKIAALILVLIMAVIGLTACTDTLMNPTATEAPVATAAPTAEPITATEAPTEAPTEGPVVYRHPLNGELLEEPYVTEKGLGDCDLEFPYKVPGTGYFVLGDQRSNSVDSRNSVIGSISRDDIIGKVFIRAWPLDKFGFVF